MRRKSFGTAVAAILLIAGCGDDYIEDFVLYDATRRDASTTEDAARRDAAVDDDANIDEEDAGGFDAGTRDAGRDAGTDAGDPIDAGEAIGEPNDTFETADPVEIGDSINGVMDRAGDYDFYRFDGTEGQWLRFYTNANPTDAQGRTDPMLTLYSAASESSRIAFNDDSLPRINTDAELVIQLPMTGTYYLRVQDFEPSRGGPQFTYPLYIVEAMTGGVLIDPETGDDAASAMNVPSDGNRRAIVGSFRDGDDVDNYRFSFSSISRTLTLYVLPGGTLDYGFTAESATAQLRDAEGDEVLGERDWSAFQVTIPPGEYVLSVIAPDDVEAGATYGFRMLMP